MMAKDVSIESEENKPTAINGTLEKVREGPENGRESEPHDEEMELDMWEGQFNLSNSFHSGGGGEDDISPDSCCGSGALDSTSRWKTDSSVTCNTVQQLQEQVGVLAENQANNDDRYTRVKQENAALNARIHMLEEHIRELEVRGEERVAEEQRRSRELQTRVERERHLEQENFSIRHSTLEQESERLKEEAGQLKREVERLRQEKARTEDQLGELHRELGRERQGRREVEEERRLEREGWEREQQAHSQVIQELSREAEELRERQVTASRQAEAGHLVEGAGEPGEVLANTEVNLRIREMEAEMRNLREANKRLEEGNEELQAQMLNKSLNEGRQLLNTHAHNNSLAAEFEAMDENESPEVLEAELEKMRKALREQQDVNVHLRNYIDTVLLNIMDKYPELLEIRGQK